MWDYITYRVDKRKKPLGNLKGLNENLKRANRYFDHRIKEQESRDYPYNHANPIDRAKRKLVYSMMEQVQQIIDQMEKA